MDDLLCICINLNSSKIMCYDVEECCLATRQRKRKRRRRKKKKKKKKLDGIKFIQQAERECLAAWPRKERAVQRMKLQV